MHEKRKKVWIDRFQTHLCWLFALYAIMYQAIAIGLLLGWQLAMSVFESVFGQEAPLALILSAPAILVVLGLIFIWDSVKYTHRIVGPMFRFRKTVQAILNGEEVELIHLRKGDYLTEMRDDMNELLKMLQQRGVIELKQPAQKQEPVAPV